MLRPSPSLSSGKITQWKSQRLLFFQRLPVSSSLVLIKSSGASLTLPKEDSPRLRAQSPQGWVRSTGVSLWMSSLTAKLLGTHRGRITCLKFMYYGFLGSCFCCSNCYSSVSNHLSPIKPVLLCTDLWPFPVDLLLCPEGSVIFIYYKFFKGEQKEIMLASNLVSFLVGYISPIPKAKWSLRVFFLCDFYWVPRIFFLSCCDALGNLLSGLQTYL